MIVVSDTSPLRALVHLDLLWLLNQLYDTVIIPPSVARELAVDKSFSQSMDVTGITGVKVVPLRDKSRVKLFAETLDPGESEAIALALELHIHVLLIDEKRGRKAATQAGLKPLGVLGLLVQAKENHLIETVEPLMMRLRREINFFISNPLWDVVLKAAGERETNAQRR